MAEATHLLGLPRKHKPKDIQPQGAGSGLDADKVDGLHASELGGGGPHASSHETGGGDLVHFADLEHDEGDPTLHDALASAPHISQVDKDKIHDRQHALDSALDHTGEITDAQHGVRTLANAHAHGHLSGIGSSDHHPYNQIVVEFTAGENIPANRCVYISANNTVKLTDAVRKTTVIGVSEEAKNLGETIKIVVHGKATCLVSGTVAAGDLLVSAVNGALGKHTPSTLSHYHLGISHMHGIPDGEAVDVTTSSTGSATIQTGSKLSGAGLYQSAVIIAKAMEGGTDAEVV